MIAVVFELLRVMVWMLVTLRPIVVALNALATVGTFNTVRVAEAAVPLPALVVVTAPVLLT